MKLTEIITNEYYVPDEENCLSGGMMQEFCNQELTVSAQCTGLDEDVRYKKGTRHVCRTFNYFKAVGKKEGKCTITN